MEQLKCFLCNVVASQESFLPPVGSRFPALATWLRRVSLWDHANELLTPSVALWNCCSCMLLSLNIPVTRFKMSSFQCAIPERGKLMSSWPILGCFDSFYVQNIDKIDVFKINRSSGNRVQNWPCLQYSDSCRVLCVAVNHKPRLELDSVSAWHSSRPRALLELQWLRWCGDLLLNCWHHFIVFCKQIIGQNEGSSLGCRAKLWGSLCNFFSLWFLSPQGQDSTSSSCHEESLSKPVGRPGGTKLITSLPLQDPTAKASAGSHSHPSAAATWGSSGQSFGSKYSAITENAVEYCFWKSCNWWIHVTVLSLFCYCILSLGHL